jgi:microcystin-dependent protein
MGSPVVAADVVLLSETAKVCDRMKSLFDMVAQFKSFLGWLLDTSGEISDAVVISISDRLTPVGAMMGYAGQSLPSDKWLVCNGQAVSRTTYATLFQRLGTQWGVGDGVNSFNLPDLQDRALTNYSINHAFGTTFGATSASQKIDHVHYLGSLNNTNNDLNFYTDTNNSSALTSPQNAILITSDDTSGAPPSAFMSPDVSKSLRTDLPVDSVAPAAATESITITIPTQSPSLAAIWMIKAL